MKNFVFTLLLVASIVPCLGQKIGTVKQEGGYTNVRRGPGSSYDVIQKVKDGSQIYYETYNKSWCKVFDSRKLFIGYIHASKIVAQRSGAGVPSIPNKTKPAKRAQSAQKSQYDWLASRKATASDLANYDAGQLRVLRNSIYARHGRIFTDKRLSNYFNSQSWYRGWRKDVPASELNKFEKYNIEFIKNYERGY